MFMLFSRFLSVLIQDSNYSQMSSRRTPHEELKLWQNGINDIILVDGRNDDNSAVRTVENVKIKFR